MKYLLAVLAWGLYACTFAQQSSGHLKEDVRLFYEAFNRNDAALLDKILSKSSIDIPPAPNQPAGPEGAKQILTELTTAFPDYE